LISFAYFVAALGGTFVVLLLVRDTVVFCVRVGQSTQIVWTHEACDLWCEYLMPHSALTPPHLKSAAHKCSRIGADRLAR
jgi:hypothetical protein